MNTATERRGALTSSRRELPLAILPAMRLGEDKLEALRRWGQRLGEADSEESAAAGRAILMLIEEVERLRLDLRAREQLSHLTRAADAEADQDVGECVVSTLHGRVRRVLARSSNSLPESQPTPGEEAESGTETDEARTSAQTWIEALRRHE